MEIAQKKKHCGLPAPAGIYKIKGENKVTGRQKDYFITDFAGDLLTRDIQLIPLKVEMISGDQFELSGKSS